MRRWPVPPPSPILVGRDELLVRLDRGLAAVSTALLYGVAGVGKSAIAYAWAPRWPHLCVYRKAHSEPMRVLVDDLRRQLAGDAVPELTSDDARLADLVDRIETASSLVLVDDLHQLEAADRAALVEAIAAGVRHGRFIATSRERVPINAGGADRLELRVEHLDEERARALWRQLDELYGPAEGFERANEVARGNPFQLRRRHAGGLEDDDSLGAAVRRLTTEERRLAGALALAHWRLPLSTLEALSSPERARGVLRRLSTLLIAEVDGAGLVGIDNLFQEAIHAALDQEERKTLHLELARVLPAAGFELAIEVREMTRHLAAAGQYRELGTYLQGRVVEMIRDGETSELLNAFDAIVPGERSPPLRLARARCLARLLRHNEAQDETQALAREGAEPAEEIRLTIADDAIVSGRITDALSMLEPMIARAQLPPALHQQALGSYAVALTHSGRGDRGRRVLAVAATEQEQDSRARAVLAFWSLCTLWMEERDHEADDALRRVRSLLPDPTVPYAAGSLVPLTVAAVLARLGRFDEVDDLLRLAASATTRDNDPYTRAYEARVTASIAFERGQRMAALQTLEPVAREYDRGGCVLQALWSQAWVGRILLVIGCRARALSLLDDVEGRARACGAASISIAVVRARALDPLGDLGEDAPPLPTGNRGLAVRARVLEALRAAASGESPRALELARDVENAAIGSGYGLDRALVGLVHSTIARLEGRADDAAAELRRASTLAIEDGVDPDLVPTIHERLGALRVVTGSAKRASSVPDLALDAYPVVLDGRTHELCIHELRIPLGRRPILRKLLYAMASRPNQVLTKEALAARIWPSRYDPRRHDNALWVNVRRLRVLLQPSGLKVELTDDGYRLTTPEGFVYVDPGGVE